MDLEDRGPVEAEEKKIEEQDSFSCVNQCKNFSRLVPQPFILFFMEFLPLIILIADSVSFSKNYCFLK